MPDFTAKRLHFTINTLINETGQAVNIKIYELLYVTWQQLMRNPTQRKILLIDEGYFLFNDDNQVVVTLLRNMFKRVRKYNVAIGIISQNITDFLAPTTQHLLLPILDNCTYKFMFHQGEQDMQKIKEMFNLTAVAVANFKQLRKSECMLCIQGRFGKIKVREYGKA